MGLGGFILFSSPVRQHGRNAMGLENVYIEKFRILMYLFALTKEIKFAEDYLYQTYFQ